MTPAAELWKKRRKRLKTVAAAAAVAVAVPWHNQRKFWGANYTNHMGRFGHNKGEGSASNHILAVSTLGVSYRNG